MRLDDAGSIVRAHGLLVSVEEASKSKSPPPPVYSVKVNFLGSADLGALIVGRYHPPLKLVPDQRLIFGLAILVLMQAYTSGVGYNLGWPKLAKQLPITLKLYYPKIRAAQRVLTFINGL